MKTALITGASRGIGRAIATGLARDGYKIWLNYRSDRAAAESARAEIEALGAPCETLPFDVADPAAVRAVLMPMLERELPDVLVNNAGIAADGLFALMSEKAWTSVLETALNGFYNVTRPVLERMMRARKGRIVVITSVSGQMGNPGQVNYSAAKAGLIGAVKALAKEAGPRGVLVNAVAPGLIATDMTAGLDMKSLAAHIPLGRAGTPEDVAGCARFLCSDWADYITGQVIAVNGGLYV